MHLPNSLLVLVVYFSVVFAYHASRYRNHIIGKINPGINARFFKPLSQVRSERDNPVIRTRMPHAHRDFPLKNPDQLAKQIDQCPDKICDDTADYPYEIMFESIKQNEQFHSYFGRVIEPQTKLSSRFGDDLFYDNLCSTRSVTREPKLMNNTKGVSQFITNVDKYKQTVVYEMCTANESTIEDTNLPLNYRLKCVQTYSIVPLLTFDKVTRTFTYNKFIIPSNCVLSRAKNNNSRK